MIIHGISKLTLLDYPGHTACTLFAGGCNFRCPFCQNGGLSLRPDNEPIVADERLFDFLNKRRKVLQGVCISGGEPTIHTDLIPFVEEIRGVGYKVKIDTNGYRPDVLEELLCRGLADAVAMDIKSSPERYEDAAGVDKASFDFSSIERSAGLLIDYGRENPGFYYEFRTTMVKEIHSGEDMTAIGMWLSGADNYFLQNYRESENVISPGLSGFSKEELSAMAQVLREYIPNTGIRNI